jgi:putative aldouronate transport system substrate-binding protein
MKKSVLLVLIVLILSVLMGCSKTGKEDVAATSDKNVTPGGTFPVVTQPVTITAFAPLNNFVDTLSVSKNKQTQWIAEKLGITLDFVEVPNAQAREKLNVMLASGDYTDIILYNLTKSSELLYGQQGVLMPLDDYIDEYGVETKKMWSTREQVRLNQIQADGKIYGMPNVNECFHCYYSMKMYVYMPWLEKLGLKVPTTPEEYKAMLIAFRDQDPNGNGKKDEVPLAGAYISGWNAMIDGFLMMPFIYNDLDQRHFLENGKVVQAYTRPEWREGLKYMADLYDEGLILPDTFTQDMNQLIALGENPNNVILGSVTAGHQGVFLQLNSGSGREVDYKTIPPFKGPMGRYARFIPVYGTNVSYITNINKNPEASFRLFDFMYTPEYSLWNGWGMKDDFWVDPDPNGKGLDGVTPATRKLIKSWGNQDPLSWWNQVGNYLQSTAVRTGAQRIDDGTFNLEVSLFDETKKNYQPYTPPLSMIVPPLTYTEAQGAEISELETSLDTYVDESIARFITGDLDINSDKDWNAYLNELNMIGVDRFVAIKQDAYNNSPFSN